MLVIKKYILPLLIIIFLAGIGGLFLQEKDLDKNNQDSDLEQTLAELSKLWLTGEVGNSNIETCQKLDFAYRRCNPHFLTCLGKSNIKLNGHSLEFPRLDNNLLPYQIIKGRYLWTRLKKGKVTREVLLENTCRQTLLDHGDYALGPQIKNDFKWSNEFRNIYVDKFQVLNWEILEWLQQTNNPLFEQKKGLNKYKTADWLIPDQMQDYCHFRNGEVVMAHILDAAFFYKTYDKGDDIFHRSPYPWQPKGRKTFIDELENKKFKLEKSHCKKIPAKECRNLLTSSEFYRSSPTWSGVFQALGGLMEYTRNPKRPRRNLNASSWHFPLNSSWHQVGQRAFWDGKGHHLSNFKFFRGDPEEKIERLGVAFRCMRVLND